MNRSDTVLLFEDKNDETIYCSACPDLRDVGGNCPIQPYGTGLHCASQGIFNNQHYIIIATLWKCKARERGLCSRICIECKINRIIEYIEKNPSI